MSRSQIPNSKFLCNLFKIMSLDALKDYVARLLNCSLHYFSKFISCSTVLVLHIFEWFNNFPWKKYKYSLYSRSFNHFCSIYQCLNFGQAWKPNISNGTGFFRQSIIRNRTSANIQYKMYNVSCSVDLQSSLHCRDIWYNEHMLQSTLATQRIKAGL